MKRTFTPTKTLVMIIVGFWAFALTANAQKTRRVSFQGLLRDASGKAVADGKQSIIFKLYSVPVGGAAEWTDTQDVNVFGGVCSTHLGSGTNPIEGLDWGAKTYYVGVTVQNIELTPRTELTFAPYSIGTPKAQEVVCTGAVGDIKHSLLNPTQFAAANGSCWVPMDGRALATTDKYRQVTGLTTLPDAGGLFFRGQEFSNSPNNDPDRTTATAIGTFQDQALMSHTHASTLAAGGRHAHSYNSPKTLFTNSSTLLTNLRLSNFPADYANYRDYTLTTNTNPNHTHTITIANVGGVETRPKNLNFWVYIRIN